ncbi:hypothetical protein [Planctomycetes bacterium TBK1r]|uniref:Knr4/Smi1-like domain-containing protein n=1 Tax=Stieleria magnilauensis TaxID=2527963 RepID=A0ABX5Y4C6_9BACT|nr:hypothetical protein TBK1r_78470 [Planctomycetes bacterium TBK1r]
MNDYVEPIASYFGEAFDSIPYVRQYFELLQSDRLSGDRVTEVDLLDPVDSVDMTEEFDYHPLFESPEKLQLLVLDDANTSNHHCLAADLPYPGCVIYLPHDDSERIVFRNLIEFYKAAETAIATELPITDFHRTAAPSSPDQTRLRDAISAALHDGDGPALHLLLQAYDLHDDSLVSRMMDAEDFCLRETIAERIASHPRATLLHHAQRCADDPHPNVWRPGVKALAAVKSIL